MNEYTRNMKTSLSANRKPKGANNATHKFVSTVLILVFLGLIGLATGFCLNVYYNSEAEQLAKRSAELDIQIANERRKVENCRSEQERLSSWPAIQQKIREFNLPLQVCQPGQVVYISSRGTHTQTARTQYGAGGSVAENDRSRP